MVQIRNLFSHIVSNFWNFIFEVINWSSTTNFVNAKKCVSRDASFWFFCSDRGRFWTQAHSGVANVSIESSQVGSLYRSAFKSKTAFGFALFLIHEILRNAQKLLTGVGFEPTNTFVYQKSRLRTFLESGALDRLAILPGTLVCILSFGLFAVVLPFWMVQIRNLFWHIGSNFWNFIFEVINWSSTTNFVNAKKCLSRDASFRFFCSDRGRFWTQAHSGVTKVSMESSQVGSWYRSAFKSKTAFGFALFLIHEILRNAQKFLTGVGFEPTHTFVYQKSRARSFLESGASDRSAILPSKL